MSQFIPDDEAIAELLDHSDVEDNATECVADGDIDFNEFLPPEEPTITPDDTWVKIPFNTRKVTEKTDVLTKKISKNSSERPSSTLNKTAVPTVKPKKPMEYFSKYIPDEVFERIAEYTQKNLKDRGKCFNYCTVSEVRKFFGIYALMGVVKCIKKETYFTPTFGYSPITNAMTMEKFKQIRLSLHIVDVKNPDELEKMTNRLWKIQPLIDTVRYRCQNLPRDTIHYSVGDQMIYLTGQRLESQLNCKTSPLALKNFIIAKPCGLVVDFEIYQGSLTDLPNRANGVTTSIVLRLARTVPDSCLYFGKNFTTIPLMNELAMRGVNGTGYLLASRFNKYEFQKDKLMKVDDSEEICRTDGKICIVKWRDTKNSLLLTSNVFGVEPKRRCHRYNEATKLGDDYQCPLIVAQYRRNIHGYNIHNDLMSNYSTTFKSKKWAVNVILYLFDLAVVNSYIEYKEEAKRCNVKYSEILDMSAFKLAIVEALMGESLRNTDPIPMPIILPPLTVLTKPLDEDKKAKKRKHDDISKDTLKTTQSNKESPFLTTAKSTSLTNKDSVSPKSTITNTIVSSSKPTTTPIPNPSLLTSKTPLSTETPLSTTETPPVTKKPTAHTAVTLPIYKPPKLSSLKDRFDGKDHWLICDKTIKSQRICRRENCNSRTSIMCSKCKIYLCFNYNKNCFYTFHNQTVKRD